MVHPLIMARKFKDFRAVLNFPRFLRFLLIFAHILGLLARKSKLLAYLNKNGSPKNFVSPYREIFDHQIFTPKNEQNEFFLGFLFYEKISYDLAVKFVQNCKIQWYATICSICILNGFAKCQ